MSISEEDFKNKTVEEEDWINDPDEKIPDKTMGYELEIWLSTDGKHTVRTLLHDTTKAKEAIQKQCELYDYLLRRYGTKQAQAVKEYAKPQSEVKKIIADECTHDETKRVQSHSDKNPGKWFKKCVKCNAFLGWVAN